MNALLNPISTTDLILFSAGYLGLAVLAMAFFLAVIFGPVAVAKAMARRRRSDDDEAINEIALNAELDAEIRRLNEAA